MRIGLSLSLSASGVLSTLGSPALDAPLQSSLALSSGAGYASFTRNSVASLFNNESKAVEVPANAPRFTAARFSETYSVSPNDNNIVTGTPPGAFVTENGVTKAISTITYNNTGNSWFYQYHNHDVYAGHTYCGRVKLTSGSNRDVCVRFMIGAEESHANIALTADVPKIAAVSITLANNYIGGGLFFGIDNRVAAGASDTSQGTITATEWQYEDVTGRSNQAPSLLFGIQQITGVFEGDSLTLGSGSSGGNTYPAQLSALYSGLLGVNNEAIGGTTVVQMEARAAANIDPHMPGNSVPLMFWGGTNDLYLGGTGADLYTNVRNYCISRKAAGASKVIVFTLTPCQMGTEAPTFETERQAFNTAMRAGYTSFADALVDVGGDSRIGDYADALDITYYTADKTHLNNTGYGVVAELAKVALDSVANINQLSINEFIEYFTTTNGNSVAFNVLTEAAGSAITGYQGVMIEPAAENLLLQSNSFTTTWTLQGVGTATQNAVGPDGSTSSGWTLNDTGTLAALYLYQAKTLTAAAHTFSAFVKKTSGATVFPAMYCAAASPNKIAGCTINTNTGVVTIWTSYAGYTIVTSSSKCYSFNDNYWRVELTFLATAVSWTATITPASYSDAATANGDGYSDTLTGSNVFANAQLLLGSKATSYIPTLTGTASRAADVLSYSTAFNIIAAAGTISLEFTPQYTPIETAFLWGTYVDASNYTAILHDATNLIFRKRISGVNYDATIANAYVSGTTYKAAVSWGAGGARIVLNGTVGTPHANTTAAQIAPTMQVGADGNGAQQPCMSFKNMKCYTAQASAAELQALTS